MFWLSPIRGLYQKQKEKEPFYAFLNEFVIAQQLWLDKSYFSFWHCIKLSNVRTICHCRSCRWRPGMEAKPWGCCLGWDRFKREWVLMWWNAKSFSHLYVPLFEVNVRVISNKCSWSSLGFWYGLYRVTVYQFCFFEHLAEDKNCIFAKYLVPRQSRILQSCYTRCGTP